MMGRIGGALGIGLLRFGAALPALFWNVLGLAGVALIAYGAWLIYQPAGFITGGVLLLAPSLLLAPRSA
jgi:hypothetical protein